MASLKTLSQLGSQEFLQLEDISQWGLPSAIVDNYREKGVERMFPWQVQCLLAKGVLQGKNLVYSAPTSAGKTLVAELLMLKRVLETRKKAIMILPFVSVTREKMLHFQNLFSTGGLRVGGYMGSYFPMGGFQSIDIAVCTIEKSNALVNKLLEEDSLDLLCCVVVDELHMLGEPQRGYLLELLFTKLLYFQRHSSSSSIQLIGMSATLPNLDLVANWLDASLYRTDYRPVPLTECVKIGNELPVDIGTGKTAEIPILRCALPSSVDDFDGCLSLVIHTVSQGFGVIVFLPTKVWCETMSQQIARAFLAVGKPPSEPNKVDPELLQLGADLRAVNKRNEIQEVLEKLQQTPAGLDQVLKKTIPYGVAFHHAGLTYDERDIIENAFKAGILNVLTATSTLSSGVNLPARRVVIRTPMFGRQLLDVLTYKQMIGRAGRKGIDDRGESILVCKDQERVQAMKLATMNLAPVRSCLAAHGSVSGALKRAILEIVASGVAKTLRDIEKYIKCTFLNECAQAKVLTSDDLAIIKGESAAHSTTNACIDYLVKNDFIKVSPEENGVQAVTPTKLAAAVLASSLSPDQALLILRELGKSRQSFVLENDLHIIYEVTPYFISEQATIDYSTLSEFYDALTEDRRRVAELIGFDLGFVYKCIRGAATKSDKEMKDSLHRRFYVALALNELVQEVPLSEVSTKFGLQKGMLQNLQQSSATFAGMMAIFCKRLGWHNLELLIGQFQKRLHFGVRQELCELLQLVPMTAQAARILFNAGFIALPELAKAQLYEVEAAFRAARAYEVKEGESSADVRWIYLNGFDGVTEREAAKLLIDEARKTLHDWLGIKVDFDKKEQAFSQQKETKGNRRENTSEQHVEIEKDTSRNMSVEQNPIRDEVDPVESNAVENQEYELSLMQGQKNAVVTYQHASCVGCEDTLAEVQTVSDPVPISKAVRIQSNATSTDHDLAITKNESKTLIENSKNKPHRDKRNALAKITPSDGDHISDRSSVNPMSLNSSRITEENSFHKGVQHYSTPNKCPSKDKEHLQKSFTALATTSRTKRPNCTNEFESPARPESDQCIFNRSVTPQLDAGDSERQDIEGDSIFDGVKTQEKKHDENSKTAEKRTSADTGDSSLFDDINTQPASMSIAADHTITSPISPRTDSRIEPLVNSGANVRVTPTKLKMLEAENEQFRMGLRASVKRRPDEDVSPNGKKARPNSSRSLEEAFNQERRSTSDDSMAFFNSSQMKNITQNAKTALKHGHQSRTSPYENDSDLIFDCVLTCQGAVVSNKDAVSVTTASAPLPPKVDPIDTLAIVSTFPACSKTNSACIEDTDSDLFSDGENAPVEQPAESQINHKIFDDDQPTKPQIRHEISDDDQPSLDLYLPSSSSSSLTLNSLPDISSPTLTRAGIHCLRDLPEKDLFQRIEAAGRRCALSLETEAAPSSARIGPAMLDNRPLDIENESLVFGNKRIIGFCVAVNSSEGIFYTLKNRYDEHATLLKKLFQPPSVYTVGLLDCLDQLKVIIATLGVIPDNDAVQFEDAGIAHWLLDSSTCSCPSLETLIYKLVKHKIITGREPPNKLKLSSKTILLKLAEEDPLPQWIVDARKIASILTKDMFPVLRAKVYHSGLGQHRIYTSSSPYTATGRMALNEPNLQSMARNFNSAGEEILIRRGFIPMPEGIILSADFSQLELRLLAHLSGDTVLCQMFSDPENDVFVHVAARWKRLQPDQVSSRQRQQAKELCYGIIYGKGVKSLSEDLGVTEEEGEIFLKNFHGTFPGIQKFTSEVISNCRQLGYIETMLGRRRYLPHIKSPKAHLRAKAERQAVNSTVQGSAADLLKNCLIEIDTELTRRFPESSKPHRSYGASTRIPIRGAFIVMQLHDEIIFEVHESILPAVSQLIRLKMEQAVSLRVPLVVKLKTGPHWSSVTPFEAL
ncbi:DNA polymerase theta-like isoform X3 [Varroa destructor]|uniref:DNA-directed DNA polymerase n=1 Tax=Varroa destructor TaxID=109461 RepID=A0A7M7JUL8_VARDE|nr:DNA polymerase theta-like isoform X3 [Varroa destructor]